MGREAPRLIEDNATATSRTGVSKVKVIEKKFYAEAELPNQIMPVRVLLSHVNLKSRDRSKLRQKKQPHHFDFFDHLKSGDGEQGKGFRVHISENLIQKSLVTISYCTIGSDKTFCLNLKNRQYDLLRYYCELSWISDEDSRDSRGSCPPDSFSSSLTSTSTSSMGPQSQSHVDSLPACPPQPPLPRGAHRYFFFFLN